MWERAKIIEINKYYTMSQRSGCLTTGDKIAIVSLIVAIVFGLNQWKQCNGDGDDSVPINASMKEKIETSKDYCGYFFVDQKSNDTIKDGTLIIDEGEIKADDTGIFWVTSKIIQSRNVLGILKRDGKICYDDYLPMEVSKQKLICNCP